MRAFMKLDRVISIATLVALVVALILLVKKPAAVVLAPQAPAAANSQSFDGRSSDQKVDPAEPVAKPALPAQPSQAGGGYSSAPAAATQPSKNSTAPQSPKAGMGI